MKKYLYCYFLLILSFSELAQAQLNSIQEAWKKNPAFKNASIAYSVIDLSSGETISELNSHEAIIPASTLKILTTAAALSILGPDYSFETKIFYTGNFNKTTGILDGDLIIYGSGDPSLQSENFYKDSDPITLQWAKILKEKGLKEIKGRIIADASYIERKVPDNWIWEDISNYYGAVPSGLSYHDNKFKITYQTKETGSEAKIISISPSYFTQSLSVQSQVYASGSRDEAYAYGDPFSFNKIIRGNIPANKTAYEIEVALPDPALLCAESLFTALNQIGVKCAGQAVQSSYLKKTETKEENLLHRHLSAPLEKMVYYTNQTSNNHYCESLLASLGKGNPEKGLIQVKTFWQQQGLDTTEVYMEDGSGLGRINTLTADFQNKALYKISKDKKIFTLFKNSLPSAGKQGSMSNLGKGTFIENNMQAKTGYMKRVRAYCGYLKTKSGKELSFSLIFNNYNCSATEAKKQMEKFLIGLAEL